MTVHPFALRKNPMYSSGAPVWLFSALSLLREGLLRSALGGRGGVPARETFIADGRVCMIVYREGGVHNAAVITLPFITRSGKVKQVISRF
ncbi:MAG: hypothetical protein PHP43_07230 [Methanoculleus sp.]|nr:hypothetical protein [Methanoculleus sp.]